MQSSNTKFSLVEKELPDISSTQVRERLKRTESIADLVHPNVAKYLIEKYKK